MCHGGIPPHTLRTAETYSGVAAPHFCLLYFGFVRLEMFCLKQAEKAIAIAIVISDVERLREWQYRNALLIC